MDLTLKDIISNGGDVPDNAESNSKVNMTGLNNPEIVNEVNTKYSQWRDNRRPIEGQWFVNAALIRGLGVTRWNPVLNILETKKTPKHRSNDEFNIILPKVRAKLSKFLKGRNLPVVTAASTDHEDILNASATSKVLEYQWHRLELEELYEEALLWAMQTGKCFWWFRWNESAIAQVKTKDPIYNKDIIEDVPLGDVEVELGNPFEVLVGNMGIMKTRKQPELMRVKCRPVKDVELMFHLPEGSIEGDTNEGDLFQYEKQISQLGLRSGGFNSYNSNADNDTTKKYVVVKELFTKPCASYPNGRYVVVAGSTLCHQSDELPYGLANSNNPYPCVEFTDILTAGQYWPTTMVEQLATGQTRFNRYNNNVDEHMKLNVHPKMVIPKQTGLTPNSFNSESGQQIYINWQAGMPPPQQWILNPPAINGDIWKAMDNLLGLNDMISNLYPAALGGEGATSGFDTNLLQEAADSVHAPDIRRNVNSLTDAAYKIRRLVKLGYDIPRLITIIGRDKTPEVFEFSNDQIDEHANITIEEGSALPLLKSARIETILKLDERGIFGQVGDPQRNRRVLRMLELGTQDEENSLIQRDENHARLENLSFIRGEAVEDPMPWENHDIEYEVHTDLLKSAEIKSWPPEQRRALVRHVLLHVKFKNPMNALQLAAMFGMQDVMNEIQQTMLVEQNVQAMMMGGQPPTQAGPPQQPQQPQGEQAPPQQ